MAGAGHRTLVDGSQAAVHMPVDVRAIGCDFYAITGHKLYGPTGIRRATAATVAHFVPPFPRRRRMIREVTGDLVTYGEPPHHLRAGTPPIVRPPRLGAA